jgi:hypothetical protein
MRENGGMRLAALNDPALSGSSSVARQQAMRHE